MHKKPRPSKEVATLKLITEKSTKKRLGERRSAPNITLPAAITRGSIALHLALMYKEAAAYEKVAIRIRITEKI